MPFLLLPAVIQATHRKAVAATVGKLLMCFTALYRFEAYCKKAEDKEDVANSK